MKMKFEPWRDWSEWSQAYIALFSHFNNNILIQSNQIDLNQVPEHALLKTLTFITRWLMKNVGADSRKPLRMQRQLIIENLAQRKFTNQINANQDESSIDLITNEERKTSMNYRLIQLVELGAKSIKYRKSNSGKKLAMKNVAEELGFPAFLVNLRHQAVHENQQITFEIMEIAMKSLQGFLFHTYWSPIMNKLRKRDLQIQVLKQQMYVFKLQTIPPPLNKLDKKELLIVLNKYTKANIKMTIGLDLDQLIDIVKHFVFCLLNQITLTFKDSKGLSEMVQSFLSTGQRQNIKPDLQDFLEVKMKHQNTFACFLFYLEKKYLWRVAIMAYQEIINQLIFSAREKIMFEQEGVLVDSEQNKQKLMDQVKLITAFMMINTFSDFPFKKVVKQYDSLKIAYGKLEAFRDLDLFCWLMLTKIKDKSLLAFKIIKTGDNTQVPIIIQDKSQKIEVKGKFSFKPMGQLLEQTYLNSLDKGLNNKSLDYSQKIISSQNYDETDDNEQINSMLTFKLNEIINQ